MGKAPTVATDAFKEGQDLSLFVVGRAFTTLPRLVSSFQKGGTGGRLLPIPGGAYIAVFAMCAMTVPTTCTAIRRAAGLGLRLRQNNQNSQNEPGMSFGINKPCRTRWGPRQGCRWVSEADRGRVELTVAVKHREKADGWEKGQP
ncbi:MAG: hypothetical protein DMG24_03415 [Acidobacteria bacterium]|nr:MAG: hypothetical protein DMG24_03415 [Acidobacteriota bacterium]